MQPCCVTCTAVYDMCSSADIVHTLLHISFANLLLILQVCISIYHTKFGRKYDNVSGNDNSLTGLEVMSIKFICLSDFSFCRDVSYQFMLCDIVLLVEIKLMRVSCNYSSNTPPLSGASVLFISICVHR